MQESAQPVSSMGDGPDLGQVAAALAVLGRQPVLLAVTLQVTAAAGVYEITVSKTVDEAGTALPSYWWEVDRLAEDERGQPHRERRWGLGQRSYDTAEAAYQAAVQWVCVQPEVSLASSDDAVQ